VVSAMIRPTTGLRPVDDLLGALRVGDNVVWETGEDATVDPFVAALVRASRKTPGLAYVSFHVSPTEILDRFQQGWDPKRFLLVDCFTDGIGRGEDTFRQFYRSRRARTVRVHRITDPLQDEAVQVALAGIESELGQGARYVFDSVTGMQELWGAEAALSFFLRSCPRLYELKTVAYWLLERQAHSASFLSRLSHVTQVVLDVRAGDEGQTLKVLKAEGRPPEVLGRHARYVFEGDRIRILREISGTRERMGEVLRGQRIARGLSQADLAQRIGISASALSQAERGRTGFSAETLTRAWEALGLGFGPQVSRTAPGWQVTRRGARREKGLAPGLVTEETATVSNGAGVHLLTFAPGTNGRRPPFATKQVEVAYVMTGLLELRVGEAKETLHAGDAITLSGEPVAAWRNPGPEDARVLWIILPSEVRTPPRN
jgi:transcriptional regulator with XRE-family HTH domain